VLHLSADGGSLFSQNLRDAGTESRLAAGNADRLYLYDPSGPLLASRSAGFAFYEQNGLRVRAFDVADAGGALWDLPVVPASLQSRLEESATVFGGAVIALTEEVDPFDGGHQSHLQLFAIGKRAFSCPLPEGGDLHGALFSAGNLYILVHRDSGWRFEAYDLAGLPIDVNGWPQRNATSGSRRGR